jgi:hypothetical protein
MLGGISAGMRWNAAVDPMDADAETDLEPFVSAAGLLAPTAASADRAPPRWDR